MIREIIEINNSSGVDVHDRELFEKRMKVARIKQLFQIWRNRKWLKRLASEIEIPAYIIQEEFNGYKDEVSI